MDITMNRDEKIIKKHLESRGFKNIIYEPIKNEPPDFLVNSQIAIEVRCLNRIDNNKKDLETLTHKIMDKCIKILNEIKIDNYQSSAYVIIIFSRPIKLDKRINKKIKEVLEGHIDKIDKGKAKYIIGDNLQLEIEPAFKKYNNIYQFGGYLDLDNVGYVVSDIYKSLVEKIIPEKTNKIKKNKDKYKIWWLALVDYIGYGIMEDDMKLLLTPPTPNHDWDKIIIVNPLNVNDFKEF